MFFIRICLMSLRSLTVHPLRTVLATMGVIFGVAAVVAAMAILEGMGSNIRDNFASMGTKRIFVTPAIQRRSGRFVSNFDSLKLEDAEAVAKCAGVQYAMPQVGSGATIKFRSKTTSSKVVGATEIYPKLSNHEVREGAFFDAAHVRAKSSVCVLGAKVKEELFAGRPAINEEIKITGTSGPRTFTIVGVMDSEGNVGSEDLDRTVIVPITTAMDRLFFLDSVQMIMVEALSAEDEKIEDAKTAIKRELRMQHKIRAGKQDDFSVQAQRDMVQQFGQLTAILSVVFYSIAGISLVVGGIGIMNIMLVAVTERTREIGVRMAMGARRTDVLQQFLIEASVVSFLGGAVGVACGWGLANGIEAVTRLFETITTMSSVIVALAMATMTGIVSGIYPAWKASRLDPVEALRYE